jgi:hypothetical protein
VKNVQPLTAEEFESEARKLAEAARNTKIELRLLGALAIRIHCPKYNYLHEDMKRTYTDLDFVAYRKQKEAVLKFLTGLGYSYDFRILAVYGANRIILTHETTQLKVDIFIDKLEFCHTIDFAKNRRLETDFPTISVSDLLAEKMQIVNITEKDIIDTCILILEHEVGNSDDNMFNMEYITGLLSQNWGFYYTVTRNLGKVKENLLQNKKIADSDKSKGANKIDMIVEAIEKAPKSPSWKLRARVGPSKKWYKDVEEVIR